MKKIFLLVAALVASGSAGAQTPPWTVTLTPTLSPLPIGFCGAVHLTLMDPATKDVPRNPQGYRISMADFDLTVSGTAVAGHQIDATHFETCGCQTGAPGTSATVTAKYPAQYLAAASRVPGVSIQKTATVTLAIAKGTVNPPACLTLAHNTPDAPANPIVSGISTAAPIDRGPGRTPTATPAPAPAPTPTPILAGNNDQPIDRGPGRTPAATPEPVAPSSSPIDAGNAGAPRPISPAPTTADPAAPARDQGAAPVPGTPVVQNPRSFTARQIAAGQVSLEWTEVPGAQYYVVFGPGLDDGARRVERSSGTTAINVPAGSQEWAVGTYFANTQTTAASEFPRVRLTVTGPVAATNPPPPPGTAWPPGQTTPATSTPGSTPAPTPAASGKYLVTITGIRAYQASTDDMLSRDGTGDEIYAGARIRRYDRRNGNLDEAVARVSAPHGDNFYFTGRVQAGSSTATGGIRDGDMIPGPALLAMRSVQATNTTFPLRLWEGPMTDGVEALVISPSLWEQDVGTGFYDQWMQFQTGLDSTIFSKQGVQDQISQNAFGAVIFGMSGNDTNTAGMSHGKLVIDTLLMMFGGAVPILSITTTTADRPIGVRQNGRDTSVLPNQTVVLTREIIERALAAPALGPIASPVANVTQNLTTPAIARIGVIAPKPGIIVIDFQDKDMNGTVGLPERPAIYQMYLQVERVP